jgi:hypothetical protein
VGGPFPERYLRAKIPNCASIIFELEIINESPILLINDMKIDYCPEFTIQMPDMVWA